MTDSQKRGNMSEADYLAMHKRYDEREIAERFSQSVKRGCFPHDEPEALDDPIELTITLERAEYEFLRAVSGLDSFTDSVQTVITTLTRAAGGDLDMEFVAGIFKAIREENGLKIEYPERPKIPAKSEVFDDDVPF